MERTPLDAADRMTPTAPALAQPSVYRAPDQDAVRERMLEQQKLACEKERFAKALRTRSWAPPAAEYARGRRVLLFFVAILGLPAGCFGAAAIDRTVGESGGIVALFLGGWAGLCVSVYAWCRFARPEHARGHRALLWFIVLSGLPTGCSVGAAVSHQMGNVGDFAGGIQGLFVAFVGGCVGFCVSVYALYRITRRPPQIAE